jgi:hypothetical protein
MMQKSLNACVITAVYLVVRTEIGRSQDGFFGSGAFGARCAAFRRDTLNRVFTVKGAR